MVMGLVAPKITVSVTVSGVDLAAFATSGVAAAPAAAPARPRKNVRLSMGVSFGYGRAFSHPNAGRHVVPAIRARPCVSGAGASIPPRLNTRAIVGQIAWILTTISPASAPILYLSGFYASGKWRSRALVLSKAMAVAHAQWYILARWLLGGNGPLLGRGLTLKRRGALLSRCFLDSWLALRGAGSLRIDGCSCLVALSKGTALMIWCTHSRRLLSDIGTLFLRGLTLLAPGALENHG